MDNVVFNFSLAHPADHPQTFSFLVSIHDKINPTKTARSAADPWFLLIQISSNRLKLLWIGINLKVCFVCKPQSRRQLESIVHCQMNRHSSTTIVTIYGQSRVARLMANGSNSIYNFSTIKLQFNDTDNGQAKIG